MDDKRGFKQSVRRVEALIAALEDLPDPAARAPARELVELVLDLHARGLERLLELIESKPGGRMLFEQMADDDAVKGLLLLHGLHPDDLDMRVRAAVERLRPHLGVQGLRVTALEIAQDTVRLRMQANGNGAGHHRPSAEQLRREIEAAVFEAAPDVTELRIDGLEAPNTVFVPLSSVARPSLTRQRPEHHAARTIAVKS